MYVQVDARGADAKTTLEAIPGVTHVSSSDARGDLTSFEVNSESGRDVRRELASTIVSQGWGLLELRPLRMSLEEIFLRLTTEEPDAPAEPAQEATDLAAAAHPEEAVHE